MRLSFASLASVLVASIALSDPSRAWGAEPVAPAPPAPSPAASAPSAPSTPAPAVPAPAPVTSAASAPDVVRLKNGGMVRGTISELVPDGDVVLVTIMGETRHFAMKDVAYAGPAADAPGAPKAAPATVAPGAAAPSEPVAIDLVSSTPDLMVHDRSLFANGVLSTNGGSTSLRLSEYRELCVAPCKASLSVGGHTLAVSSAGGRLIEAQAPLTISGASEVRVNYESKRDIRSVGVVLFVAGTVAAIGGPALILANRTDCSTMSASQMSACIQDDDSTGRDVALALAGGAAVATVGILLAVLVKDVVDFEVVPPGKPASPSGSPAGVADAKSASQAWLHFGRTGVGVNF